MIRTIRRLQMKKIILGLFTLAALSTQAADLDLSKSEISWVGKKAVVDSKHLGNVKMKSGSLEMKDGKLTGGEVVVDMNTINTTDLEGKWKTKLEGHLKNDDFFKVDKYPTATFKATSVKAQGKDNYKVTGDMKILNKTNSVDIVLTQKGKSFTGDLTIDRTKWDLKYGSGSFFDDLGDKAIADEIALKLNLVIK